MPVFNVDMPLTDILASIGITHSRDERTDTDRAHRLYAPDGSLIGRYDAFEAWRDIEALAEIAASRTQQAA